MNRHHASVALAAATLLLAGCSDSASGGAAPSTSSTSASTTATSSTTPAAPSTSSARPPTASSASTAAGDPNVPLAARAHTKAGAEAFVRNYIDRINEVGQRPVAGEISRLGTSECVSCMNYEQTMVKMTRLTQHYSGPIFTVLRIESVRREHRSDATVDVDVMQLPIRVLAQDGSSVRKVTRATASLRFDLSWEHDRWLIAKTYFTAVNTS